MVKELKFSLCMQLTAFISGNVSKQFIWSWLPGNLRGSHDSTSAWHSCLTQQQRGAQLNTIFFSGDRFKKILNLKCHKSYSFYKNYSLQKVQISMIRHHE